MTLMFNAPEAKVFGGARDPSYPAPVELLHVSVVHTGPGIDDLIHFYQIVLNMRMVYRFSYPTFEFVAISHDDENHRLGFVNVLDPTTFPGGAGKEYGSAVLAEGKEAREGPLRPCRLEHTSWRYHDFHAVLMTAKRIHKELGIWPRTSRHDGVDVTIDYNDPDGNRVELLSQTPTKPEILLKILRRSEGQDVKRDYTETYMGFDMSKMLDRLDEGTPLEKLMDREYCRSLIAEGKL